jgi:exopolysaccharide biosynthesis predicted pyruvyltransferase EpsI
MSEVPEVISAAEKIGRLKEILRQELGGFVAKGARYALLDFPDHSNVGDSAIWLGEIELLTEITGRRPDYVCTIDGFDVEALRASLPEGVIFIHGGGNFGDLWKGHQDFRLRILELLPDRQIVQLPQSIHFLQEAAIRETVEAIESHGDFHLLVRDQQSLKFSQDRLNCTTRLVPDAAFGLGPLRASREPIWNVLCLFREDSERSGADYGELVSKLDAKVLDWLDEPKMPWKQIKRRAIAKSLLKGDFSPSHMKTLAYNLQAERRMERGVALLSSGRLVITDRLHAHIICTLMSKRHIALDNTYGKVSGYYRQWLQDFETPTLAYSVDEALAEAVVLV